MKRRIGWRALLVTGLLCLVTITASLLWRHVFVSPAPVIWPLPDDPTEARKARLINALLPAIQKNNRQLLEKREYALGLRDKLDAGNVFDSNDLQWLQSVGKRYRLPQQAPDKEWMALLLRRLDIIPADLALAQAAMESAWGTSRFAEEGNNYFGQWCFTAGCGIVPAKRPAGASYEVRHFDSVYDSVRGYMRNLNSHPRYTQLRIIRETARKENRIASGVELAAGLHGYSAIGDTYIKTLRALIRANRFQQFENY